MSISKNFDHQPAEEKWYKDWIDNKYFESKVDPSKKPYTIVIPPPNVTGVLHVGHVLNNTIQDVFIRKARMEGFNACWVPGTDHASIATEAKVVAMLKEKGIDKKDLSREEFLKYAFEWKETYGSIILNQLKKLGASCDWNRTTFTMDDHYYKSVIKVFVDLYNKGFIYRGSQMINWDTVAQTALSDEEVYFKESNAQLFYVKYKIEDSEETISVATTRPETIFGDTAICVHPEDERFIHLIGKKAIVPIINRLIPIIADEYVDREFGTGALKITPAHDKNDYELGKKHQLETIDVLNSDGTMSKDADVLAGMDRVEARKKMGKLLEESGNLIKIEQITNNIGLSERTHSVVEPRISNQWFCKMNQMADIALEVVVKEQVKFIPPKFVNMYKSWMESIREWCISRQLWWGQRIPAYYLPDGSFVVAVNIDQALELAKQKNKEYQLVDLTQENDVLDTWFSSWLWPLEVFKGISQPNNPEIEYYYPTQMLVTAPEIIFFWVARMIMAGMEYKKEIPFENVYFTGIVRDEFGRKYSKSLGNSPDIFKLLDQYGADALRFGILIASPAGNDIPFNTTSCDQGRNFINKFWNALKLIKGWEENGKVSPDASFDDQNEFVLEWFENKIGQRILEINKYYQETNLPEVITSIYNLIWDDFCSWYLELIKPSMDGLISDNTYQKTINFMEQMMQLLNPFMPFVTEEIYHLLKERNSKDSICVSVYPQAKNLNIELLKDSELIFEVITKIRGFKAENNISLKEKTELFIKSNNPNKYQVWSSKIEKLAAVSTINFVNTPPEETRQIIVKSDELFFPSVGIDKEAEIDKLEKELNYTLGFLKSVDAKLSNEKFVQNAKEDVLIKEQTKKSDALARIKVIEENLSRLK